MALPPNRNFENPDGVRNASGWGGVAEGIKGRKRPRPQSVKEDWDLRCSYACVAWSVCGNRLESAWDPQEGVALPLQPQALSHP